MKPARFFLPIIVASLLAFAPTFALADDDREPVAVPVVRLAMGPGVYFEPDVHPGFALDLTAGAIALSNPTGVGLILGGELGYSFDTSTLNAFNFAGAVGVGTPLVGASFRPRFLVGTLAADGAKSGTSVGMRNGIMLHFIADTFSFEVGHQFVTTGAGLQHDVHVLFGFNPAAPVFLLVSAMDGLRF